MANVKVRDLTTTQNITNDNKLMVLTDENSNQVKNITVENFLNNIKSANTGNGIVSGTDGKLYVDNSDTGVTAGTYAFPQNLEVDSKGRIIGVVNGTPASVPIATSSSVGIVKPDNDTIIVDGNGTIACTQNNGYQMFDIVMKDHVLSYEETLGLAQLGTYVYKEAIAGTRYGYPDYYAKVVAEYQDPNNTTAIVDTVTVTINSNGHKFYDIADKATFDNMYAITGEAWYYCIDTTNERIFLPRSKYITGYVADGDYNARGTGITLGLTNGTENAALGGYKSGGTAYINSSIANYGNPYGSSYSPTATDNFSNGKTLGVTTDSTKSGITTGISNATSSRIPYMVVGNQSTWAGMTDVVNQGMTILSQVNAGLATKLDLDLTNITNSTKSNIAGYAMPSDTYDDITLGASGATYTAPANGSFAISKVAGSDFYYVSITNTNTGITDYREAYRTSLCTPCVEVKKNDVVQVNYNASGTLNYFRFIYAKGSESEAS